MELYNVMNLLCFFKSADFYFLEIIPSLFLQVLHTHYSSKAKLTLYLCKAVGFSAAAVTFRFCQRGKETRKARNCFPTFSFLLSKTHFLFFPVCFSIQNFKAVETSCWSGKEGELCTFSRKISIHTNNMVLSTWKELIEKHCLYEVFWSLDWGIHG